MKQLITVMLALSLSVASAATAQAPKNLGKALVTFYWTVDESSPKYRDGKQVPLYDSVGRVLAHTTAKFRRDLVREGTGSLRDGRTLIYLRTKNGQRQFRVAGCKYGLDRTGRALSPYRSVAVDPRLVKLGSRVYIPQLKGTRLPDGSVHDGMFIAGDTGSFRGRHVDIFVGAGPGSSAPFVRSGYGSRSHVTLYVVD